MCVEPEESRVFTGGEHKPHTILGIGAGMPVPFLKELAPEQPLQAGSRGHVSEFLCATSAEAVDWATQLAQKEGLMVGPTSGATFKVAMDIAARPEAKGKTIVVMAASHGIRYTAHPLWKAIKEEARQALPQPPNMAKEGPLLFWDSSSYSATA